MAPSNRLVCAVTMGAVALLAASSNARRAVPRLRPPDVRYVPTPRNVAEAMLELARAR